MGYPEYKASLEKEIRDASDKIAEIKQHIKELPGAKDIEELQQSLEIAQEDLESYDGFDFFKRSKKKKEINELSTKINALTSAIEQPVSTLNEQIAEQEKKIAHAKEQLNKNYEW
ncbi:hypothetical protein [Butyrivibrio sp. AE2032]|uniref:hypothetical protein n=1 Tax=Butyrivibrio sp. AE2032 TaxID=1458463 RepID=UPI00054D6D53|nr:hypothetical protein [Butyrivibrio sp. AE2032]